MSKKISFALREDYTIIKVNYEINLNEFKKFSFFLTIFGHFLSFFVFFLPRFLTFFEFSGFFLILG